MLIRLKETLNEAKGYVQGTIQDWHRPTITGICQQLGRRDWYEPVTTAEHPAARQAPTPRRSRREVVSA